MPSDRLPSRRSRLVAALGRWPVGWRRTLLLWLIPAWLVTAAGVAARWWDALGVVPMLQALFPLFGILAVMVLALVAITRVGWAILIAAATAAGPVVLSAQALTSETVESSPSDEVVLALNLEYGSADPASVVALVRDLEVNTVVLTELTQSGWNRLRSAGLASILPNGVGEPAAGASGTMIRSSHPLTEVPGTDADELFESFAQPIARVERPSGSYLLRGVHPNPPVLGGAAYWHRQLGRLGQWQKSQAAQEPLVLAGDFNASRAHPVFRGATRGLTDAQSATGAGWVRTWPTGKTVPAFVAIDHIMTRGAGVADAGDAVVPGTDHRAVWARLSIA